MRPALALRAHGHVRGHPLALATGAMIILVAIDPFIGPLPLRNSPAIAKSKQTISSLLTMNKKNPRTEGDTRLDRFLAAKKIGRLAFAKATGYSSQQVRRVRFGEAEPTAKAVPRYVKAARLLTNDPSIKANDLFPLDDDDRTR